jgi:hypothetical protein
VPFKNYLQKNLVLCAIGVFATAWIAFIWPTQWEHYKVGQTNVRVNRFTGETEYLSLSGWKINR